MKLIPRLLVLLPALTGLAFAVPSVTATSAQAPTAAAPQVPTRGVPPGGPAGGRGGGLPGATAEQNQAVTDMLAGLVPLSTAVTAARMELTTATFAEVPNAPSITAAAQKLRAAELALATARAEAFARLQEGPNRLTLEQVTALVNSGGVMPGGRRGGGGAPAGPLAPAPAAR